MTERSGIDFVHHSGGERDKPFPAANGSGVGAIDFDRDGWHDLYFATGRDFPLDPNREGPTNRMYRNLGEWKFSDVTAQTQTVHNGYSAGVAVGDYDNDGFPDLYVTCYGENCLFRNLGDGTFMRAEQQAHVADDKWGTSAAFLDANQDGFLDLYVCNYAKWTWQKNHACESRDKTTRMFCVPTSFESEPDVFYINQADGTFVDATTSAGLAHRLGRAQGIVTADLNNDGLTDIYIANDMQPNSLFLNQGEGRFLDATELSGAAYDALGNSQAGMGVTAGDYNCDGKIDLFVTNFTREYNTLYENLGNSLFLDVSQRRGTSLHSLPNIGWGTALVDFNGDGWLDLIVANGHFDPDPNAIQGADPRAQYPLQYENSRGQFNFLGRSAGNYFAAPHIGRGISVVDLDNDGAQDVVISHLDGRPAVLRNVCLNKMDSTRPVLLQLIGTESSRDAIGAAIVSRHEKEPILRQVQGGTSYLSAHDYRQTMVMSPEVELEIHWPNGMTSRLTNVDNLPVVRLVEPTSSKNISRVRP